MLTPVRTVAFLMLLAGLSLGVFAGRALVAVQENDDASVAGQVDEQLRLYRERYDLNDRQAEEVRRALADQYRRVREKMAELRRQNEKKFRDISAETDQRIQVILREAGH